MRFLGAWAALAWLGVVVASAQPPAPSPPAPKPAAPRPNFVFILADDLRADSLGVAGNDRIHTPNLDALARRSAYFTRATVYVAQCCPCRAMLITGLTPHQSGYISIDIQREPRGRSDGFDDLPTLPGLLAGAGYRTVLVGKWHLRPDPWRCGFSDVRSWLAEGAGPRLDPPLCHGRSRETAVVKGYTNEIFAGECVEFLRSPAARERPFFLWLAPTAPHGPLEPTPERIDKLYEGKTSRDLMAPGITPESSAMWRDLWLPYYRSVTHLDEQVGRVLAALDEQGLAASTVVVFASDSGVMMGRRGIDSKVVPYEDSVRVPLIIHDPRSAGRSVRSPAPVSDLDLPVTILARAGLPPPTAWPGRDLTALAAGTDDPAVRDAICEWVDGDSRAWGEWAFHSVFDGRHKLIVWRAPGRKNELYNVETDPYEERNLADLPESAPVLADLRARLAAWLERTGEKPAPGRP